MPFMNAVVVQANTAFNSANLAATAAQAKVLLAPGSGNTLVDAATTLLKLSPVHAAQLNLWPPSVLAALQAALYDAVNRAPPVSVQFLWTPAAGHGLAIWEAAGVDGSYTSISVHLQSPLPAQVP